jgi:GDP-4-dehydro-6-deoxy-D-mannose reductase
VNSVVRDQEPDSIVHLAGISSVGAAEGDVAGTLDVNVLGAVRLATAAARLRKKGAPANPRVLVIGSGTQYGSHPPSAMPLGEDAAQQPVNTYGASKAAQEIAVLQIYRATGLPVIATRSFNHSAPGQDEGFLLPSLVKRIKALGRNGGRVAIGNDVVRDYLHVDDVANAYVALLDRGMPGEVYNVCSGVGVSVSELASTAARAAAVPIELVTDPALQRSQDTPALVGSCAKLRVATGWRQRKDYQALIGEFFS